MRWPWQSKIVQRSCWVWCPACRRDLNGDNESFVSDDERGVRYRCASCGLRTAFDFDLPAPVRIPGEWKDAA
jgi:hypothetical protein